MKKDALNSSRPILSSVQSSEQIEEMFDSLPYFKVLLYTKKVPRVGFKLILYISKLHDLDYFKDYMSIIFRCPVEFVNV